MKLSILFSSLFCAAFVSAQQPVQQQQPNLANAPAVRVPPPAQTFDRTAGDPSLTVPPSPSPPPTSGDSVGALKSFTSPLNLNRLLTAGPIASFFEKMGLYFAGTVGRSAESAWDPRIPFITDENFDEVIVREALTPEEEAERVWFLIISMTAGQNSAISKLVDQSFDQAYNHTLAAGDLPHVRWGRINYTNATFLTTKWSIWSGPYLVVVTDRGQTLRFYKTDHARVTPELLRELLTEEHWRHTRPWKTEFAPGGSQEWILHYCASGLMHMHRFANRFPRWMLLIGFGVITVLAVRVQSPAPAPVAPAPAPASAPARAPVTMAEEQLQPSDQPDTEESSCAVATSRAIFGSAATASATASPSKGATPVEPLKEKK